MARAAGGQEVGRYHGSLLRKRGLWHLLLHQTSHGKRRIEREQEREQRE